MKEFVKSHKNKLIDVLTILPTSWTLFISIAGFYGVIDFFGPIFRYLISSWQFLTRGIWDYLIFSWFDIYVRDADKDALTFSLFFVIFGYSLIPKTIKVIKSDGGSLIRDINWKIFPIAFVISSTITMLVISHLFNLSGAEKYKTLSFVFSSTLFLFFYLIVGFVPIFISYVLSTVAQIFIRQRKNRLKEFASIIILLFSAYLSLSLMTTSSIFEYFKATVYVTCLVVFLVVLIPLLMPIIQPEKLVKLALLSLVICAVAYASYTIEYFKQRAIAERDGYIKDVNSSYAIDLKNRIDTNCSSLILNMKNDDKIGSLILAVSGLMQGKTEADFVNKTCPCFASEIVKNEKTVLIERLAFKSEFEEFLGEVSSSDIFNVCSKM